MRPRVFAVLRLMTRPSLVFFSNPRVCRCHLDGNVSRTVWRNPFTLIGFAWYPSNPAARI